MNTHIDKIKLAFTIFDIGVIFLIAGVAWFSALSYYNTEIEKTEDYLKTFYLALKVVYYLGMIAFVHMIFSLVYTMYRKWKEQDEMTY